MRRSRRSVHLPPNRPVRRRAPSTPHWPGRRSINQVTIAAQDPVSKIPEFKVCAVRIRPSAAPAELAVPREEKDDTFVTSGGADDAARTAVQQGK